MIRAPYCVRKYSRREGHGGAHRISSCLGTEAGGTLHQAQLNQLTKMQFRNRKQKRPDAAQCDGPEFKCQSSIHQEQLVIIINDCYFPISMFFHPGGFTGGDIETSFSCSSSSLSNTCSPPRSHAMMTGFDGIIRLYQEGLLDSHTYH